MLQSPGCAVSIEHEIDLEEVAISICNAEGFTFHHNVGGGSFKKVFLIEADDTKHALKVFRGPASSPRTQREIEAILRCDHPNIAKLLGVGTHEYLGHEYAYTLEEFLSGGTLSEKLEDGTTYDDTAASELGQTLIAAVSYLARMDLVHRDIKPDNIVYREDGVTPVLVDFGIVRDLSASSLTQTWAQRGPGTPYFAAPEQLRNEKRLIDWRTDQFSLGVVLFFLRYAMHPYQFPGEPLFSLETVKRVADRKPRSDQFFSNVSNSALPCLTKMTAPWPVRRYRTPEELEEAWNAQAGEHQ